MIRFFKSPQPAIMIIIPVIILLFWIRSAGDLVLSVTDGLPLWDGIISFLAYLPSWLTFIVLYVFICAESIYLNLMLNRHEVIYKNTFIPALIFALFVSSTPILMQFHPIHIVNLLLIRVLDRLFTLFKNEAPVSALFDIGFLSGIMASLFLPAILMLPLIMASLAIMRSFKLKEWLIAIIGFTLPFFFISVYTFWNHSLLIFWNDYFSHFKNINTTIDITLSTSLLITSIFIGLLFLLSLLKLRSNYRKNVIRMRIYQQIFFIFLLLSASSLFLLRKIQFIDFAFLLIPVSVFCGYYFVSAKKREYLYEYSLWVLIGLMIWNQV